MIPKYHINLFWSEPDGAWVPDEPGLRSVSAFGTPQPRRSPKLSWRSPWEADFRLPLVGWRLCAEERTRSRGRGARVAVSALCRGWCAVAR